MERKSVEKARAAIEGAPKADALAVELEAVGLRGMITLRGDFANETFAAAVRELASVEIPGTRRFAGAPKRGAAWMSPDELLITLPYAEAAAGVATLDAALAGIPHLAVDVSDARQVFRLTGAGAREVLAKGAPIDLHPSAFGPGDLRRTRIGQIVAMIVQTGDAPESFEVYCFRSYGAYLWRWLQVSAAQGSLPSVFANESV